MPPFLKTIRSCSIYLGLTSLEHPQSEPRTCHKETTKFRNKEALEGVSGSTGFTVTDGTHLESITAEVTEALPVSSSGKSHQHH